MAKTKNFLDEDAREMSYELDRMKSNLMQISKHPVQDGVDEQKVKELIEQFSNKIDEIKAFVNE